MGVHLDEESVPQLIQESLDSMQEAVIEVGAGNTVLEQDGITVPYMDIVLGELKTLCSLDTRSAALNVLSVLDNGQTEIPNKEIQAKLLELDGDTTQAIQAYKELIDLGENSVRTCLALGNLYFAQRKFASAEQYYFLASQQAPDDLSIIDARIDNFHWQQEPGKAADLYEECFSKFPEILQEKSVYKRYKKFCKQDKRTPVPQS